MSIITSHTTPSTPVKPAPRKRNVKPATPSADGALGRALATLESLVKPTGRPANVPPATLDAVPVAKKSDPIIDAPIQFVPGRDEMRAELARRFDADGFPIPAANPTVTAPAPARTFPPVEFDLTRDNGTIFAVNARTGNGRRFRVAEQHWGHEYKRVAMIASPVIGPELGEPIYDANSGEPLMKWVSFAFVDAYGVRPWGPSSKCPLPHAERVAYAEFLMNMATHAGNGKVTLTVVRD